MKKRFNTPLLSINIKQHTEKEIYEIMVTLTLWFPRSDYQFSSLAATHFLVNKSQESGDKSGPPTFT